ncbi:hypothetical protein LLE49_27765 [Alicyclobacillus tolerans]|uniref:hypothetical protein n=1 Tax=Alicyclobacillus tolerans TaxID=90970 RepID=UPI001F3760CC|nr:hypothetical protein [Alicyclobacillus tolerans]MCF8568520.1 hypothetical protein [Alicyclobacillus tolerans]
MSFEERLYFECGGIKFDVSVQRERWFGAVWAYKDGVRCPLEYWFEDTEDKLYEQWQHSRWYGHCTVLFTPYPINQVYNRVRARQIEEIASWLSQHLKESADH